mgnify:CR=1 FL=1
MEKLDYIVINRNIQDDPLWLCEKFSKGQALLDLLFLAKQEDSKHSIRGNWVRVKRGQIAISERFFSERWKWSRGKVRGFLKYLENEGLITQQKNNKISILTIVNYDNYVFSPSLPRHNFFAKYSRRIQ